MFIIGFIVWKKRIGIYKKFKRLQSENILTSAIIGSIFAAIDELICFPFNPLVPGITLVEDILLTTPMYFCAHLFWASILKKYRFTQFQALLTGGISIAI